MSDYISREAAISKIRDEGVLGGDYDAYEREEDVVNTLNSIPAADVVEVVRCKDCKYDERCMFQDFVRDERVEPYDKTVFYCADGKHKDGWQDDV